MNFRYPNIDFEKSGKKIKWLADHSGYTVKQIQEYLHLSCPQPIYRWFKGQVLPSLVHAYALSRLFHVHMEELFVSKTLFFLLDNEQTSRELCGKRLYTYYEYFIYV